MLMIPRPFMVERGHDDGVGIDEWVALEFAKVRRRYNKLGERQVNTKDKEKRRAQRPEIEDPRALEREVEELSGVG